MRALISSLFLPLILAAGGVPPVENLAPAGAELTALVAAKGAAPKKVAAQKNAAKKGPAKKKARAGTAAQAGKVGAKSARHVRKALKHLRVSRKQVAHAKGLPAARRTEIIRDINAVMAKLRAAPAATPAKTPPPKTVALRKKKR